MQGKLLSISPKMKEGVQETYTGKNGLLYIHVVTMEINGTPEVGDANSKSTSPPWKTGDNYSFERAVNGAQGQFIHYSKLENLTNPKPAFVPGGGGGGKAGGIEFAKQKAAECAYHATAIFWSNPVNKVQFKAEIYHGPTTVFYKHIVETGVEKDIWLNIAAFNALCDRSEKVYHLDHIEGLTNAQTWTNAADKIKEHIIQMLEGK